MVVTCSMVFNTSHVCLHVAKSKSAVGVPQNIPRFRLGSGTGDPTTGHETLVGVVV